MKRFITEIVLILIFAVSALPTVNGTAVKNCGVSPQKPLINHCEDRYFAKDKLYHFGVSAVLSFGSYYVYREGLNNTESGSYYFSGGFTISIGALKEYYDSRHPDNHCASWKDFIADIAGAAAGLSLAYLVFEN